MTKRDDTPEIADGLPKEKTEKELALSLPIIEIVDKNIRFKDREANKILLLRAVNEMEKIMNQIQDENQKMVRQKKDFFKKLRKEFKL